MKYNEDDLAHWGMFAVAALEETTKHYLATDWAMADKRQWAASDAASFADAMMAERAKRMEGTR